MQFVILQEVQAQISLNQLVTHTYLLMHRLAEEYSAKLKVASAATLTSLSNLASSLLPPITGANTPAVNASSKLKYMVDKIERNYEVDQEVSLSTRIVDCRHNCH